MNIMEYLKEYQTRQMYDLIGVGLIKASEIIMFDLEESDKFRNIDTVEAAFEKLIPEKWWYYDDEDARAFAQVKLDFGEKGIFEKFGIGESTFSHWSLYTKALDEFNANMQKSSMEQQSILTMNDVKEIVPSLDGRLWEKSKIIVLMSYDGPDEEFYRINKIYYNLLEYGIDIRDYNLLRGIDIPEVSHINAELKGIYSCKVDFFLPH